MTTQLVRRRSLVGAATWALPVVTVAAAAPAASASAEVTCPATSPLLISGSITVPADICTGGTFTGDFTYTVSNPTSNAYWFTPIRVETGPFNYTTGQVDTWTVVPGTTLNPDTSTAVAPGIDLSGSGNIPGYNRSIRVKYQLVYSVAGPGLPTEGCTFTLPLGYGYHCE